MSAAAARLLVFLAAAAVLALAPGRALAAGGSYVFDGGTARQQSQVKAALEASSFNWSLVPATITIHIGHGHASQASPGRSTTARSSITLQVHRRKTNISARRPCLRRIIMS